MLDNPTWYGALLCRFGFHRWSVWGKPEDIEAGPSIFDIDFSAFEVELPKAVTDKKPRIVGFKQSRQCMRCGLLTSREERKARGLFDV